MASKTKIGALWQREGPNGTYFTGSITLDGKTQRVIIFRNSYKTQEKQPDYEIYESQEYQAKDQTKAPISHPGASPKVQTGYITRAESSVADKTSMDESDIPF